MKAAFLHRIPFALSLGAGLLLLTAAALVVGAQEKGKSDDKAKEKKTDAAPAAAPAAPAAPSAADAYVAVYGRWQQTLKDLRSLRKSAKDADEEKLKDLYKQWDEKLAAAQKLLPELRKTGIDAFTAQPNADRRLTRFLIKMLEDDVKQDRYADASKLAKALIDAKCDDPKALQFGGVAAFAMDDFDAAEKLLQEAEENNAVGVAAQPILASLGNYKKYWEKEQAIREKEAKADDLPRVKLTTSKGDITIELFENEAPETVGNFVSLVENDFYDGLSFHRVLPGFMAQGGCPNGDGRGDPGYSIYCEWINENARMHFRGSLSMAHSGKDTGGSQFFLTFRPTPQLNKKHTVFGRVVEGLDVLEKIQRRDPEDISPPTPDKILKAEVIRKRDHAYVPNKVQ